MKCQKRSNDCPAEPLGLLSCHCVFTSLGSDPGPLPLRRWQQRGQQRLGWEATPLCLKKGCPPTGDAPLSECNIFTMTSAASKIRSRRGQCQKVQGKNERRLVPKDHSNPLASRKRWPSGRQGTELVPLLLVPCLFTDDMR